MSSWRRSEKYLAPPSWFSAGSHPLLSALSDPPRTQTDPRRHTEDGFTVQQRQHHERSCGSQRNFRVAPTPQGEKGRGEGGAVVGRAASDSPCEQKIGASSAGVRAGGGEEKQQSL